MTVAVEHPLRRTRFGRRSSVVHGGALVAARPLGAAGSALLMILFGAWAGIAVFVGPLFGYKPTSTAAWSWTMNNWLLHLLPGAVAVIAGVIILGSSPGLRWGSRSVVALMSLVVIGAGAWLVIGPDAWTLFRSSAAFRGAGKNMEFLYRVGSSLGPGVILVALGGMAFRSSTASPRVEVLDDTVAPAAVAPAAVVAAPAVTEPGASAATERPVIGQTVAPETTVEPPA